MRVQALGHVVLKVRDLDRSLAFYNGVLGMPVVARAKIRKTPMAFFSVAGNHHDFALMELGGDASSSPERSPGLAHVAFKIGSGVDELRAARSHLQEYDVAIDATVDHTVSKSLYLRSRPRRKLDRVVCGCRSEHMARESQRSGS
ncbi:MAG: VOC family protein [Betaproteobacteria bacterium]|nr:MAG: VOC family protein [Betaproteobacteria bacterium]